MHNKISQPSPEHATVELPSAFRLFNASWLALNKNLAAYLLFLGMPLAMITVERIIIATRAVAPGAFAGHQHLVVDRGIGGLLLFNIVLNLLLAPGLVLLQLKAVRRQAVDIGAIFSSGLRYFWRYLLLGLLVGLILLGSLLLLIVPFFIVLPRVVLAPYFLIDRNLDVIDALRASNEAYKQYHGVWGVLGVTALIGLASIVPVIGFLLTTVIEFAYTPAFAIRYEQIRLLSEDKPPRTPIEIEAASAA